MEITNGSTSSRRHVASRIKLQRAQASNYWYAYPIDVTPSIANRLLTTVYNRKDYHIRAIQNEWFDMREQIQDNLW